MPAALSLIQVDSYHSGTIANLSMGGCFFPMESELPLGAECDIAITVGEALEIENYSLKGVVVRSDSIGVGIKFTEGTEQLPLLLKMISAQKKE